MEFQISNKAKKVTLGLMGVGLLLLIVGFFFQKEYLFPTVLSDHEVYVEYWGEQGEKESDVKAEAQEAMAALGYQLDFGMKGKNMKLMDTMLLKNTVKSIVKKHTLINRQLLTGIFISNI